MTTQNNIKQNYHKMVKTERLFYHLRAGEEQPEGPYSSQEIVKLIAPNDYLFREGWPGWKLASQVYQFDEPMHKITSEFCEHGQDPEVVAKAYQYMDANAWPDEKLHYIGVQYLPAMSITAAVRLTMPKAMIITNKRFCVFEPRMVGEDLFKAYPMVYIGKAVRRIKHLAKTGSFVLALRSGSWVELNKLPSVQLNHLQAVADWVLDQQRKISLKPEATEPAKAIVA